MLQISKWRMVKSSMPKPDLFYSGITRLSHMMCLSHFEVIHIVEPPFLVPCPIISFVRISWIRIKSRYISVVQFKSLVIWLTKSNLWDMDGTNNVLESDRAGDSITVPASCTDEIVSLAFTMFVCLRVVCWQKSCASNVIWSVAPRSKIHKLHLLLLVDLRDVIPGVLLVESIGIRDS